jgi:hypothetical protein
MALPLQAPARRSGSRKRKPRLFLSTAVHGRPKARKANDRRLPRRKNRKRQRRRGCRGRAHLAMAARPLAAALGRPCVVPPLAVALLRCLARRPFLRHAGICRGAPSRAVARFPVMRIRALPDACQSGRGRSLPARFSRRMKRLPAAVAGKARPPCGIGRAASFAALRGRRKPGPRKAPVPGPACHKRPLRRYSQALRRRGRGKGARPSAGPGIMPALVPPPAAVPGARGSPPEYR